MWPSEEVEIVATDKTVGAVIGGSADTKMVGDDFGAGPAIRLADVLPTIVEIAGVDSSTYSLPDDLQHPLLEDSTTSLHKRHHSPPSPVGAFLLSERRVRLRKAGSNMDFESKQLDQQLALTQQYTNEIIRMRIDQSRLEEQLKKERQEIELRNERLLEDLRDIEQAAAQITQAEAELALLKGQYEAELHLLGEEKDQTKHAMQPAALNATEADQSMLLKGGYADVDTKKVTIIEVESVARANTQQETIVPQVNCKANNGSKKKVPLYAKGMNVSYKSTNTKTPAIIMDLPYSIRLEEDGLSVAVVSPL